MSTWYYFARPTNLAFHDFTTTYKAQPNLKSLLGLGLKFIPTPKYTTTPSKLSKDDPDHPHGFSRFDRDLHLRCHFAGKADDENDPNYNPRMYIKSTWRPPPWNYIPEVERRMKKFETKVKSLFKKRPGRTNLLPHQHRALSYLQKNDDILVAQCDKGLGPCIIEKPRYIQFAFRDHFNEDDTYRFLSPLEAAMAAGSIKIALSKWMIDNHKLLTAGEIKFLKEHISKNVEPFPVFYLTFKVHKSPLKTHPIVSCSGSLLYALGVWIDDKLQAVARAQRSYFKSSTDLKRLILDRLQVPQYSRLFTADAVSMYTNIPTEYALTSIAAYLQSHRRFRDLPVKALTSALRLVMTNNIFTFGDVTYKQLNGAAMGSPPVPPYATLYYAIHEETFIDEFPEIRSLYKRFIDDVVGVWTPQNSANDDARWTYFQERMNACNGLEWTFSRRRMKVDFMDITLSIKNNRIFCTLYEKAMNLYLYIPPHSAHPPGVLSGLVIGMVQRIHTLCTDPKDANQKVKDFYRRILARGYKAPDVKPLFQKAYNKLRDAAKAPAPNPLARPDNKLKDTILFHLTYHPNDPPSTAIQDAWRRTLRKPVYGRPLPTLLNHASCEIGLDRMLVCYRRPLNLGNLLSYRKLTPTGPPVSSYMIRPQAGPVIEPPPAQPPIRRNVRELEVLLLVPIVPPLAVGRLVPILLLDMASFVVQTDDALNNIQSHLDTLQRRQNHQQQHHV